MSFHSMHKRSKHCTSAANRNLIIFVLLVVVQVFQCVASFSSSQLVLTSAAFTCNGICNTNQPRGRCRRLKLAQMQPRKINGQTRQRQSQGQIQSRSPSSLSFTTLHSRKDDNNDDDETTNTLSSTLFDRFTSPKIDDAGLPIADSLLSQIVAPTMQITYLSIIHAPIPSWLYSTTSASNGMLFASSSSSSFMGSGGLLIVPTLIHGAGLTLCWVLGCLAAKNYESDAFNISGGRGYTTVLKRLVQSGSFAVGVLILSTQLDLFVEFGGRYVQPGMSDEIDLRLFTAIVEVLNDIIFEVLVLSSWRIYRASLTGSADGRPPDYKP